SSVRHRQMTPRPCVAMKLIASGVANSAAIVRSPSFSRSGASTTTTNFPARKSSSASSMVAKAVRSSCTVTASIVCGSRGREQLLDVLREDVHLEIHGVAGSEQAESRHLERMGDERDRECVLLERGDRERDALHGDRALLDAVAEALGRRLDR